MRAVTRRSRRRVVEIEVHPLTDRQYRRLLAFRTALRRFLQRSAERSAGAGLTPQQHQLLLMIRAWRDLAGPSIHDIAHYLLVRDHSALELVNRATRLGLVNREPDAHDKRVVRVTLTDHGRQIIERLAELHLEELRQIAPALQMIYAAVDDLAEVKDTDPSEGFSS